MSLHDEHVPVDELTRTDRLQPTTYIHVGTHDLELAQAPPIMFLSPKMSVQKLTTPMYIHVNG